MSLSCRFVSKFPHLFAVTAIAGLAVLPAGSQPLGGRDLTFTSPQFVVTAVRFKANDETGWYWTGSDEVYAVFSDMDPTHYDRTTSVYGDVDEGETKNFRAGDRCMSPQPDCDRGTPSVNVRFAFWERDVLGLGLSFCPGDYPGLHTRLEEGMCSSDDFIGSGSIIMSQQELVAALPSVGASKEYTVSPTGGAGKYRFTYRISRLANVERSIVIHLPPDIVTTISLQAAYSASTRAVELTWSGATTSNVDVYRNGAKIITTTNDGAHSDAVATGTYQYRICNLNSTTVCSANASAVVP